MATRPGFKVDLTGVSVLVVDDNADARDLLTQVFQYCGALVYVARSTKEALGYLGEVLPSIIVSDLLLPEVDGFAFIRALRKMPPQRGGALPAIAISAHYEDFKRAQALRLGFNEYLQKPLDLERLCGTLVRLIHTNEIAASEKLP